MNTSHTRSVARRVALPLLVVVAALAALAPAGLARNQMPTDGPQMLIGPPTVHVKKGKIALKAICPVEASSCSGVITGRLPLRRKPGSLLDPGSLGGRFFDMQPGQTIAVVFRLTAKTKAFLKTHVRTTLNLTVKALDDEHNESVTKVKLTLFAI